MLGVVLLTMGGPSSLDEVEPFLRELFGDPDLMQLPLGRLGRKGFARLLARLRARGSRELYRAIGGRSPLPDITKGQAQALEKHLTASGLTCRCRAAMRYTSPRVGEVLRELVNEGVTHIVAVPLYPHFSRTTTGSSFRDLDDAVRRLNVPLTVTKVRSYPDDPGYVAALADTIQQAAERLPHPQRAVVPVLFSAHGLPQKLIRQGDPYEQEVRTTVSLVSERLSLGERSLLSFQSKVGPLAWLGPSTLEVIEQLGRSGARSLVVVPVSFVADNIETLHELDIVCRAQAEASGIVAYIRAPALNEHPLFIEALAQLVQRHTEHSVARGGGQGI